MPFGYYNDMRTKTVAVNKKAAELVRQCFELYARGDKTCGDITGFFANGVATRGRSKTKNGPSRQVANAGTKQKLNICLKISFTMDTFATLARCTRASIRP